MTLPRFVTGFLLALAGILLAPGAARAAATPVVQGTQEVEMPGGGGRMLLVYGLNLTKASAFALDQADGTAIAPLTIVFKAKTLAGLLLPASLVRPAYSLPGDYRLRLTVGSGSSSVDLRVTMGYAEEGTVVEESVDPALRTDLQDAATVGGEGPAQIHDASLLTGTVDEGRFSARDDLVEEGAVGTGAGQVAAGDHAHDARYPLRTELSGGSGTVNAGGNPVDWSQIKGMPAAFADGTDDSASYSAGTGLSLNTGTFAVAFAGTGAAGTAARSDHDHDASYYTKGQLNSSGGTVNNGSNPVDWSQIKGMPAGFADGVDEGGGGGYSAGAGLSLNTGTFSVNFAGTGTATSAAKSDHNHDASYYTQTQLNAAGGTINNAGNPMDWSRLKGMPAGFSDGADNDTTYTAGNGLTLTTGTFAVSFAGGGAANTAARSDHAHAGTYLNLSGGETISGKTTVSSSSEAIVATSGTSSSTTGGIDCTTSGGIGVAGHGDVGVLGDLDSSGTVGVWGKAAYDYQTAVRADASGRYGYALYAYKSGYGTAVRVRSTARYSTALYAYGGYSGTGLVSYAYRGTGLRVNAYTGTGVDVYCYGKQGTGLKVRANYSQYLAVFQSYGSNVARINSKGTGFFNGGTQSYGADFAESVKVDGPVEEFEPGDVMVIDIGGTRRFSLCREAGSPLVAGVISTRPAVLGTAHDVARGRAALKEEVRLGVVGIVPTKVCDEGGPIRAGDMLVSAALPGHAKKAPPDPAVGTVLGKALAPLDRGTGRIEILLTQR